MSESADEFEIEYLDEDADIVQQCVQAVEIPKPEVILSTKSPLLVERVPKRKKKVEDDDDYNPREEIAMLKKRKSLNITVNKTKPSKSKVTQLQNKNKTGSGKLKVLKDPTESVLEHSQQIAERPIKHELTERRKLDICIPDYEDPLCLPVKSTARDSDDLKKTKNWNQLCMNRLEHADTCLEPEMGKGVKSHRTVVLRNMKHKITGKIDTTIWSKVSVENNKADRKSEVFQCILPKFREKKTLNFYLENHRKSKNQIRQLQTIVIGKEETKDGDQLVTYRPQSHVAAVYKTIVTEDDKDQPEDDDSQKATRQYLKELTSVKMCAPCYQLSWRGQQNVQKKNIQCTICHRSYVSVYNLLAHVKSGHDASEVRRHKHKLSKVLAQMVDYHYRCRVCSSRLPSIKELRKHINRHQGNDHFFCEIGEHMAR